MAVTSVAPLRRCPTSPESVPHFSGIRNLEDLKDERILPRLPGLETL